MCLYISRHSSLHRWIAGDFSGAAGKCLHDESAAFNSRALCQLLDATFCSLSNSPASSQPSDSNVAETVSTNGEQGAAGERGSDGRHGLSLEGKQGEGRGQDADPGQVGGDAPAVQNPADFGTTGKVRGSVGGCWRVADVMSGDGGMGNAHELWCGMPPCERLGSVCPRRRLVSSCTCETRDV